MEMNDFKKNEFNPAQILALGFAGFILFGAVLLDLPIATASMESAGFINSLFTATSAVCVTGLIVVDTGIYWSLFGKIVILLLIQIGGIGIMTMATMGAVIIGRKITLKNRLLVQEALNQFTISGVIRLVKYIVTLTLLIETIGAALLSLFFIPIYGKSVGIFYGIFHSISAFCNAGFDLLGNGVSFIPFVTNSYFSFVVMGLIILGGLGFAVIVDVAGKRSLKKITLHSKMVLIVTAILLMLGFVMFLMLEFNNPETLGNLNFADKLTASLFQSVTPRTAGFNTINTSQLTDSSKVLTMMLMFIGGSPGSTAGGIKVTTITILILAVFSVIIGRDDTQFFRRKIGRETINRALTVFLVSLMLVFFMTFLLTVTEKGKDFADILFETISAFGTVGLSTGITSSLTSAGKIIISIMMFTGRIGPLTLVIALASRDKKKALIKYPEGKISVG